MSIEYPCRVCKLEVKDDDKSIQYDLCDKWNHLNCVNVNKKKYEKLMNYPLPWYCSFCENELSFSKMSNNNLKNFLHAENCIFHKISSIKTMSKKTREMMKHFCQMNQVFDNNENTISCDYYNIEEPNKLNINRHYYLFILRLNISSLSSNIDDLQYFLVCWQQKWTYVFMKVDYVSKQSSNYEFRHSWIYFWTYSYWIISRKYPNVYIYSPKELESIFIEFLFPNKLSSILGTIYKHPSMKPFKFNNKFLEPLLSKIKAEGKDTFLWEILVLILLNTTKRKALQNF